MCRAVQHGDMLNGHTQTYTWNTHTYTHTPGVYYKIPLGHSLTYHWSPRGQHSWSCSSQYSHFDMPPLSRTSRPLPRSETDQSSALLWSEVGFGRCYHLCLWMAGLLLWVILSISPVLSCTSPGGFAVDCVRHWSACHWRALNYKPVQWYCGAGPPVVPVKHHWLRLVIHYSGFYIPALTYTLGFQVICDIYFTRLN